MVQSSILSIPRHVLDVGVYSLSLLFGRDNYGFVTYRYAEEAFAAIEGGQALCRPDEQPFDLCFGGRRQFCKRNYADLGESMEESSSLGQ